MSQLIIRRLTTGAALFAAALLLTGCSNKSAEKTSKKPAETTAEDATEKPTDTTADASSAKTGESGSSEVVAMLVKADMVDGKEDKVVSKCGGCALGMNGKADHALAVSGGYTMHFCSAGCKSRFEKDPDKSILALSIPAG